MALNSKAAIAACFATLCIIFGTASLAQSGRVHAASAGISAQI